MDKYLKRIFKCSSGLELRHKRSLYQSVLYMCLRMCIAPVKHVVLNLPPTQFPITFIVIQPYPSIRDGLDVI